MRGLVLSLVVALGATGCASADVAAGGAPHPVSSTDCGHWTPTPADLDAVRKLAIKAAAGNIPPGVPSASWVACTRGGYLALSGEGMVSDRAAAAAQVIVVIIRGRFPPDPHDEPPPQAGASTSQPTIAPTVSTLDFDYDPSLGYGLDGGTGLPDADIARIGSFQPLRLS
jgi:hypothetical protein